MVADCIAKNAAAEPREMIEMVIQRAPITTHLAAVVVRYIPDLSPMVAQSLLASPFALVDDLAKNNPGRVLSMVELLARHERGYAGDILAMTLSAINRPLKELTYSILHAVGRLPYREITSSLIASLQKHEQSLLEGLEHMTNGSMPFSTPTLMLGAYRTGSNPLKEAMFVPDRFDDAELYELGLMAQEPIQLEDELVASYLRVPGDTSLFMFTLFAGNPHLDARVVTRLCRDAWAGKGINAGDISVNTPKAAVRLFVESCKLLRTLEMIGAERIAGMLDELMDAAVEHDPESDITFYQQMLLPTLGSEILLKTRYGTARADVVLEIDLGL
jgi:hypothetical protein